jgi:hypothetical protein
MRQLKCSGRSLHAPLLAAHLSADGSMIDGNALS